MEIKEQHKRFCLKYICTCIKKGNDIYGKETASKESEASSSKEASKTKEGLKPLPEERGMEAILVTLPSPFFFF